MTPRVILRPAEVPRLTEAGAAAGTAAFDDLEWLPLDLARLEAAGADELAAALLGDLPPLAGSSSRPLRLPPC